MSDSAGQATPGGVTIRVTRTFGDGTSETWKQAGDTEVHMRHRMAEARRTCRQGAGWLERDHVHDGITYTERIDWLTEGVPHV